MVPRIYHIPISLYQVKTEEYEEDGDVKKELIEPKVSLINKFFFVLIPSLAIL